MLRRTTTRRAVALAAVAVLALTGCDASDAGGRKARGGSSDAGGDASGVQENKERPLRMGRAAAEPVEITRDDRTGKFRVAVRKVVLGKAADLAEGTSDPKKFRGQVPAWVYIDFEHVGGEAPATVSTAGDWGVTVRGGERGRPLIMMLGDLPATPADCKGASSYEPFTAGQKDTVCQVFVVPEGKTVDKVQLSRGFHSEPTTWTVS
jgi:hypothetical protein